MGSVSYRFKLEEKQKDFNHAVVQSDLLFGNKKACNFGRTPAPEMIKAVILNGSVYVYFEVPSYEAYEYDRKTLSAYLMFLNARLWAIRHESEVRRVCTETWMQLQNEVDYINFEAHWLLEKPNICITMERD